MKQKVYFAPNVRKTDIVSIHRSTSIYFCVSGCCGHWLSLLEEEHPAGTPEQVIPPKPSVWRRLLARSVDYTIFWELILACVFRINLTEEVAKSPALVMQLLESAAVMVCIMLLGQLFLHWWGSAPGKWVVGISVTGDKGKYLSYRDALCRGVHHTTSQLNRNTPR